MTFHFLLHMLIIYSLSLYLPRYSLVRFSAVALIPTLNLYEVCFPQVSLSPIIDVLSPVSFLSYFFWGHPPSPFSLHCYTV